MFVEQEEDEECRLFAAAKRKMIKMRMEKERDIWTYVQRYFTGPYIDWRLRHIYFRFQFNRFFLRDYSWLSRSPDEQLGTAGRHSNWNCGSSVQLPPIVWSCRRSDSPLSAAEPFRLVLPPSGTHSRTTSSVHHKSVVESAIGPQKLPIWLTYSEVQHKLCYHWHQSLHLQFRPHA